MRRRGRRALRGPSTPCFTSRTAPARSAVTRPASSAVTRSSPAACERERAGSVSDGLFGPSLPLPARWEGVGLFHKVNRTFPRHLVGLPVDVDAAVATQLKIIADVLRADVGNAAVARDLQKGARKVEG